MNLKKYLSRKFRYSIGSLILMGVDITYRLSPKVANGLIFSLVWLLWRLKFHRSVIEDNLKLAFPQQAKNLPQLTKQTYLEIRHTIRLLLDLRHQPPKKLVSEIEFKGLDLLLAEHRQHQRVIIVSAHNGIWPLPAVLPQLGIKTTIFLKQVKQPFVNHWFYSALTRPGAGLSFRTEGMIKKLQQNLADNSSLVLVVDFKSANSKTVINFFNRPSHFGTGAYRLAIINKVPLFFVNAYRTKAGQRVIEFKPMCTDFSKLTTAASRKATTEKLLKDFISLVEQKVTQNPATYLGWFNRRSASSKERLTTGA